MHGKLEFKVLLCWAFFTLTLVPLSTSTLYRDYIDESIDNMEGFYLRKELWTYLGKRDRTAWPLYIGKSGAQVENLNNYLSLFSNCLINIQNYHGIHLGSFQIPLYLTRFDEVLLKCESTNFQNLQNLFRKVFSFHV